MKDYGSQLQRSIVLSPVASRAITKQNTMAVKHVESYSKLDGQREGRGSRIRYTVQSQLLETRYILQSQAP